MIYESDIEKRLVDGVTALGGIALKYEAGEGWPDRICILPGGRILWVELKRYDGRLSKLQIWRHKQLRSLGHRVEVPYTKEDVDKLLGEVT